METQQQYLLPLTKKHIESIYRLIHLIEIFCNKQGGFLCHIAIGSQQRGLQQITLIKSNYLDLLDDIKRSCEEPELKLIVDAERIVKHGQSLSLQGSEQTSIHQISLPLFLSSLHDGLTSPQIFGADVAHSLLNQELAGEIRHLSIHCLKVWDARLQFMEEVLVGNGLNSLGQFRSGLEVGGFQQNSFLGVAYVFIHRLIQQIDNNPGFVFSQRNVDFCRRFCQEEPVELNNSVKINEAVNSFMERGVLQMEQARLEVQEKVKYNVMEYEQTWLSGQFGNLTLTEQGQ